MTSETVQTLFDEFAAAHARGERPDVRAYLARAGAGAEELGLLIDRYLQAVPAQPPDEETLVLLTARVEQVTPLTAARTRLPLKVDDVVYPLRDALGLSPAATDRLRTAYQELEAGQLDPAGVHERVWNVLQKILRLDPHRLLDRPKPKAAFAAPAYMRMADVDSVAGSTPERGATPVGAPDEVDFFFRGGNVR
jgi:hypothetical protein